MKKRKNERQTRTVKESREWKEYQKQAFSVDSRIHFLLKKTIMSRPDTQQDVALKLLIGAAHRAQERGAFTLEESGAVLKAINLFVRGPPSSSVLVQLGDQITAMNSESSSTPAAASGAPQ